MYYVLYIIYYILYINYIIYIYVIVESDSWPIGRSLNVLSPASMVSGKPLLVETVRPSQKLEQQTDIFWPYPCGCLWCLRLDMVGSWMLSSWSQVLQLIVGYSGLCLKNQQGAIAVKLITQAQWRRRSCGGIPRVDEFGAMRCPGVGQHVALIARLTPRTSHRSWGASNHKWNRSMVWEICQPRN